MKVRKFQHSGVVQSPTGGRPVEWLMKEGKWYPIHPYIFAKKKGGKI